MYKRRIARRWRWICVLAVLLALAATFAAMGDDDEGTWGVPDWDKKGSITVNMLDGDEQDGSPVPGGEMALWRVADVVVDDDGDEAKKKDPRLFDYFFKVTDKFEEFGDRIDGRSSIEGGAGWPELAMDLAEHVDGKRIDADERKTIGEDGRAKFGDLEIGLYLLVQTEPARTDVANYSSVNPFLVTVPQYDDVKDDYIYEVKTYPKTGSLAAHRYGGIGEMITAEDDVWDRDEWTSSRSVNKMDDITIEVSAGLPVVSGFDVARRGMTLAIHGELDQQLDLNANEEFELCIGGTRIDPDYYDIVTSGGDGTFRITVDLTALYNDGVIDDGMLLGDTELTVFFHVRMTDVNDSNHYGSTVWYELFEVNGEGETCLLHRSGTAEVYVYTISLEIVKIAGDTGRTMSGVTFALFTDERCSDAVSLDGVAYRNVTDASGIVRFEGLKAGVYYLKEESVGRNYRYSLRHDPIEIVLEDNDGRALYSLTVINELYATGNPVERPERGSGGGGSGGGGGGSGGGSGAASRSAGASAGGPGVDGAEGEAGNDGSGNAMLWELLPIPKTGEGKALLAAVCVMAAAGAGLIITYRMRRRG